MIPLSAHKVIALIVNRTNCVLPRQCSRVLLSLLFTIDGMTTAQKPEEATKDKPEKKATKNALKECERDQADRFVEYAMARVSSESREHFADLRDTNERADHPMSFREMRERDLEKIRTGK